MTLPYTQGDGTPGFGSPTSPPHPPPGARAGPAGSTRLFTQWDRFVDGGAPVDHAGGRGSFEAPQNLLSKRSHPLFVQRLAVSLVGAVLVLGGVSGAPAVAASQSLSYDCDVDGATVPVTLAVGETLTVVTSDSSACLDLLATAGTGVEPRGVGTITYGPVASQSPLAFGTPVNVSPGDSIVYTATEVGSAQISLAWGGGIINPEGNTYVITVTDSSGDAAGGDPISVTCTGPVTFYGPIGQAYDFEFGPACDTGGSTDDGVTNSRVQDLSLNEAGFLSEPPEPDSGGDAWYVYAYYGPFTSTLLATSVDGEATLSAGDTVAWTMGPGWPTGTYPIIWGGPGRDRSTTSAASNPTRTLTLDANGGACPTATLTGSESTWPALPTDCVKAGSTLLGWSTSAAFPVPVAQRQVDLGWGVVDGTFNGTRMIFIPTGGHTALTGDNTLHAIWG